MKDWWTKFSCFMIGWNYDILISCTESSRKQLKKYASAILILVFLWFFIGYSFAQRYIGLPWWGCVITAVIFVVVIIQIERQIILTVKKRKVNTIIRLIIAIIMAIIGSAILDQIIFKDDIEKKMIEIIDRQVNEQLPNRLIVINEKLQSLQVEIDSIDKKNIELQEEIYKRPTINTISTVKTKQQDGSLSTTISTSPMINPKSNAVQSNNKQLEVLRNQLDDYTQRKMLAEEKLRTELKLKQGFLEELNAILEIISDSTVALIFYIILLCFLISLEMFVVISKSGDSKCDYDYIIEYQLEQKIKTLEGLIK